MRHLPTEPLGVSALPPAASRDEYEAARARLLVREKAHTREGDAIAAERRIKGWTRAKKQALIRGDWDHLRQLAKRRGGAPR